MYLLFLISSCMLWWRFCLTLSTNPMTGNVLSWLKTLTQSEHLPSNPSSQFFRAGNSLIGFPSESLVFTQKRSNEQFAQKTSDSLIRSFLVSDLSDLLMIAHFLWAMWANPSGSLIFGERSERFTHITHLWWATWAICSHCSILVSDLSDSLTSLIKKEGMSDSLIF